MRLRKAYPENPCTFSARECQHAIKDHPDRPHDPIDFVKNEIEAELYAYNKVKKPTHIKHAIVYWVTWILDNYTIVPTAKAIDIVGKALEQYEVPQAWLDDFEGVVGKAYKDISPKDAKFKFRLKPEYQKMVRRYKRNVKPNRKQTTKVSTLK